MKLCLTLRFFSIIIQNPVFVEGTRMTEDFLLSCIVKILMCKSFRMKQIHGLLIRLSGSGSCCCGAPSSSCTRPRWPSSRSRSPATSCSPSSQTAFLRTWRRGCCPPPASVSLPSMSTCLFEHRVKGRNSSSSF